MSNRQYSPCAIREFTLAPNRISTRGLVDPPDASIASQTATFTVSATGTPPLSYQWFRDGASINGATNAVVSDISTSKGANLSLLGVFFGIGALGTPFLLAVLKNHFSSFGVISTVGFFTVAVGLFYIFIKFPPSKKELGFSFRKATHLFTDNFLFLVAFYLFFQGSLEAIINNWTTTYLTKHLLITESRALYALSLFVAGMTLMRLPANETGLPMTYMASGRQFIVVAVGAAGFPAELVALALPRR